MIETNPPEPMHSGQRAQLRATIVRVHKLYPGPTGDILAQFISDWEEFGYRFDSKGLMARFIKQVWGTKLPDETVIIVPWVEV